MSQSVSAPAPAVAPETPTAESGWQSTCGAFSDGLRAFRRYAWGLTILASIVLIGLIVARQLIHEHIRRTLEARLNEHYESKHLRVEIGAVRFRDGEGFDIKGLRVLSAFPHGEREVMVSIDHVQMASKACLLDLVKNNIEIDRVEIDGVRAYAHRDEHHDWNLAALFPPPSLSETPAPLRIINGQLIVDSKLPGQEFRIALDNLELSTSWHDVMPGEMPARVSPANAQSSTRPGMMMGGGAEPQAWHESTNVAMPKFAQRWLKLHVSFEADRIERAQIDGLIDMHQGEWIAKLNAEGIDVSEKYLHFIPESLRENLVSMNSLNGQVDVEGRVAGDFAMSRVPEFKLNGRVRNGRIEDSRIPYPIDGVGAQFAISNDAFQLANLTARFGSSDLELSSSGGWPISGNMPLCLTASGKRVRLDESVVRSLPESIQKVWRDYSPNGWVDLDISLTFDGSKWIPDAHLKLLDVSILPRTFPYRIDSCSGTIDWRDGECDVDITGFASGRPILINGTVSKNRLDGTRVTIRLPNAAPIDENLMAAVAGSRGLHDTLRAFSVAGMMTCEAVLKRSPKTHRVALDSLVVNVSEGAIEYDKMPYPVRGIKGQIVYQNETVEFVDLNGENDGGRISVAGKVFNNGWMDLNIHCNSIPMEDELRDALPSSLQEIWRNLRPAGVVDQVTVRVTRSLRNAPVEFEVHAAKFKAQRQVGKSLSIQPVWFPYRLHDLTGSLSINKNRVTIEELEAFAGTALVSTRGQGEVGDLGWITHFENLSVDGLLIDESFLQAMPQNLSGALRKLQPKGPINLFGGLTLSARHKPKPLGANSTDAMTSGQVGATDSQFSYHEVAMNSTPSVMDPSLVVEWDVKIDMDNGGLTIGRPVEHLFGGVRLVGRQDHNGTHQVGWIDIDSMVVEDVQLTSVRGPLRITPANITFGRWARASESQLPHQPVMAKGFGGIVSVDAEVQLNEEGSFAVQTFLDSADLGALTRQVAPAMSEVSGVAHARLELGGNAMGLPSLRGKGNVRLRDAKIYEFPVILSLLKVLSIKQPDNTAFTTSNVDFQIVDEHFYFERIEFIGDAISLKGNGDMDFSGQMDLMFYSVVGRDEIKIPIISPLFGAASQNILQIQVEGPIGHPQLRQTPFPALNETLQQIFPEVPIDAVPPVIPGIPSITETIDANERQSFR